MDTLKDSFQNISKEYDKAIINFIPYYNEMVRILIESIPYNNEDEIRVLDLGCGTGNITKKIKDKFPNAHINCLDLVEEMIQLSKTKLKDYEDIDFVVGDFSDIDFNNNYDLIISSLAIHHIKGKGKLEIYKKIFSSLNKNGYFLLCDKVLAVTEHGQKLNHRLYNNTEKANFHHDFPSTIIDNLKWFDKAGFKNIDVVWKYYGEAILIGNKS
jgi:tRNA (cmo5U34)-methyltransferase